MESERTQSHCFTFAIWKSTYRVPTDTQHPLVQAAIAHVALVCGERQVPSARFRGRRAQYERWRAQGVNAFLPGDDRATTFKAMKQTLEIYRSEEEPTDTGLIRIAHHALTHSALEDFSCVAPTCAAMNSRKSTMCLGREA
jgi:hypothetical protein